MDCLSSYAMTKLIGAKDRFDIAFGNDPDRLDLAGARNRDRIQRSGRAPINLNFGNAGYAKHH